MESIVETVEDQSKLLFHYKQKVSSPRRQLYEATDLRPGTCVVEYKSDKQRTQQISDWDNKGKKASPAGHFDQ